MGAWEAPPWAHHGGSPGVEADWGRSVGTEIQYSNHVIAFFCRYAVCACLYMSAHMHICLYTRVLVCICMYVYLCITCLLVPLPLPPYVEGGAALGTVVCADPLDQGPHRRGALCWDLGRGPPRPLVPRGDASLHTCIIHTHVKDPTAGAQQTIMKRKLMNMTVKKHCTIRR